MANTTRKNPEKEQDFHVIRIQAKREASEPNDVSVCINGRNWVFQRERLVPVTGAVVEALRHAVYPVYRQVPGEDRRTSGHVSRYPFEVVHRNIGREAYETLREMVGRQELDDARVAQVLG
jgi:hypothetical protein